MLKNHLLFFVFMCWLAAGMIAQASADNPHGKAEMLPPALLFSSDEIFSITVSTDIQSLQEARLLDDPEYQNARITVKGAESRIISAKVKVRGNFRRDTSNCEFPPLRFKFKDDQVEGTLFEGQKKIKLVTHCTEDIYLLKEYMVYGTYQILNDMSLKTRLAEVTYVDTRGNYPPEKHFAFFLEHPDALAARSHYLIMERDQKICHHADIEREHLTFLCTFNYMVGNRDWDVSLQKNLKIFCRGENDHPICVPYDFDFSGTVDAPYTLKNVGSPALFEMRKFRARCRSQEEMDNCFALFHEKKEEIYAFCSNVSQLDGRHTSKVLKYYDKFFKIIENPKKVQKEFLDFCPDSN